MFQINFNITPQTVIYIGVYFTKQQFWLLIQLTLLHVVHKHEIRDKDISRVQERKVLKGNIISNLATSLNHPFPSIHYWCGYNSCDKIASPHVFAGKQVDEEKNIHTCTQTAIS